MPSVMIQEICDPVQRYRGLSTAGSPLDNQDLVLRIADDRILLLLNGPDDILKLDVSVDA